MLKPSPCIAQSMNTSKNSRYTPLPSTLRAQCFISSLGVQPGVFSRAWVSNKTEHGQSPRFGQPTLSWHQGQNCTKLKENIVDTNTGKSCQAWAGLSISNARLQLLYRSDGLIVRGKGHWVVLRPHHEVEALKMIRNEIAVSWLRLLWRRQSCNRLAHRNDSQINECARWLSSKFQNVWKMTWWSICILQFQEKTELDPTMVNAYSSVHSDGTRPDQSTRDQPATWIYLALLLILHVLLLVCNTRWACSVASQETKTGTGIKGSILKCLGQMTWWSICILQFQEKTELDPTMVNAYSRVHCDGTRPDQSGSQNWKSWAHPKRSILY